MKVARKSLREGLAKLWSFVEWTSLKAFNETKQRQPNDKSLHWCNRSIIWPACTLIESFINETLHTRLYPLRIMKNPNLYSFIWNQESTKCRIGWWLCLVESFKGQALADNPPLLSTRNTRNSCFTTQKPFKKDLKSFRVATPKAFK